MNGAAQAFKVSPGLPKFTVIFDTRIQLIKIANFGTRHRHGHGSVRGVVMISVNVIDSTVTYKLKNQKKVDDAKAKFSEMFSLGLLLSAFTIASVTAFGSVPVSGPSRFTAAIKV